MLISLDWLKQYVDIKENVEELENTLTMIGQEVEAIEVQGAHLNNVVIGEIVEYNRHPEADTLTLLKVNVGEEKTLSIVCGAPNHKLGDKVVVARIGAVLPGDFKIKKSKIRGAESEGMLCSEVELGLGNDGDGIIILPLDATVGTEYREFLGMNDTIFELEITPNRPDCLSHIGIAREVAAYYKRKVKYPKSQVPEVMDQIQSVISGKIVDRERCKNYVGRYIRNVEVKESPEWLKRRIMAMGLKPINNIVDATNFVMFEYNQPVHAFDADKIVGGQVQVRKANPGEKIVTLDKVERELSDELVIADKEKALAIAGIIGGANSEVDNETKNIFLEIAAFTPENIRKTVKRLGISTDASYRFERGVDRGNLEVVADRIALLINEVAGGETLKGRVEESVETLEKIEIPLNINKLNKFIGKDVSFNEIGDILTSLKLDIKTIDTVNLLVTPPTYRSDLYRPEDLYEEVIRMYGFQNIEDKMPVQDISAGSKDKNVALVDFVKVALRKIGLQEVINYSFISKKAIEIIGYEDKTIEILNPITDEFAVMRPTLMYSLLANIRDNFNRNQGNLKFSEVSRVFFPADELANEEYRIGIALAGKKEKSLWDPKPASFDFFTLKGYVEALFGEFGIAKYQLLKSSDKNFHPGRSADIFIGRECLGTFGEIHPDLAEKMDIKRERALVAELNLKVIEKYIKNKVKYERVVKYPEVTRDLAIVLDETVLVGNLLDEIRKSSPFVESVNIFDVYQGENIEKGKKSVAISFVLRNKAATLDEKDIQETTDKILKIISNKFNGQIRN